MGRWSTRYQALIVFLNRRCTTACATCSAGAASSNKKELTPAWLEKFFQRLKQYPSLFSGYVTWTGGEPFLSFDSLYRGITLAHNAGYHSEILTGGGWLPTMPKALETLNNTASFSLRISLDAEHQKQIPLEDVIALIQHAVDLNIEVNFTLRDIPNHDPELSAGNSMTEIKRQLPLFYDRNRLRSRWIHRIPHIPFDTKPDISMNNDKYKRKRCRMAFRDLVIGEDGLVYPCCGFFGIHNHEKMALGDPLIVEWEKLSEGKENHEFCSPCERCTRKESA